MVVVINIINDVHLTPLYPLTSVLYVTLGLCSDETETGDGDGGGGPTDGERRFEEDGTGMGEGEGGKDVSDQIDNEEQLLGLKVGKGLRGGE